MTLRRVSTSEMRMAASVWRGLNPRDETGVFDRIDELINEIERLRNENKPNPTTRTGERWGTG